MCWLVVYVLSFLFALRYQFVPTMLENGYHFIYDTFTRNNNSNPQLVVLMLPPPLLLLLLLCCRWCLPLVLAAAAAAGVHRWCLRLLRTAAVDVRRFPRIGPKACR